MVEKVESVAMNFVSCFSIFGMTCAILAPVLIYYRLAKWKNYMLAQGRWKPWREVRNELRLGRGVLFIDYGGPDTISWWVPDPSDDEISIMEAETGFATYCPLWYRYHFVFRKAFPNSKLHESHDIYFP